MEDAWKYNFRDFIKYICQGDSSAKNDRDTETILECGFLS